MITNISGRIFWNAWNYFLILLLVMGIAQLARAASPAAGDWENTIAGTVLNGRLYTIETSGALYETNLGTGKWVQIGKPEFSGTQYLIAGGTNLLTIENDGSLYRVSPADGSWKQLGGAGEWKNTIAATYLGGKLFTVESSGGLYETNPLNGSWRQIGKSDFGSTRHLFSTSDLIYSIESDGSLYRIKPADGSWARAREAGGWKNTIASTVIGSNLYTVETSGVLYGTSLVTGKWKVIGKAEFAQTRFMFNAGGSLYTIETNGNLYRVNPTTGTWVEVG